MAQKMAQENYTIKLYYQQMHADLYHVALRPAKPKPIKPKIDPEIEALTAQMAKLSLNDIPSDTEQRGVKRKCTSEIVQGDHKRQRTDHREVITSVYKKRKFADFESAEPCAKRQRADRSLPQSILFN